MDKRLHPFPSVPLAAPRERGKHFVPFVLSGRDVANTFCPAEASFLRLKPKRLLVNFSSVLISDSELQTSPNPALLCMGNKNYTKKTKLTLWLGTPWVYRNIPLESSVKDCMNFFLKFFVRFFCVWPE